MKSSWSAFAQELKHSHRLLAGALTLALAAILGPAIATAAPCSNSGVPGTPYEGFGAATPGGAGKPIYRVTTLADWGPGSLRDALSKGDRCIVFDVAGDIVLRSQLSVQGAFLTVDGFSARAPGITLRDYGITMWGTAGVHDVILRGFRVRNSGQKTCVEKANCWDGIQMKNGISRVVIDHVSIDNSSDGAIDIGRSSDITVQWSMLSGTGKTSLIGRSTRISMHHNLFIDGVDRNPHVYWDESLATQAPDTVLDLRNNVVWNFAAYGAIVHSNAVVNFVKNYYYSPSRFEAKLALVLRNADLYGAGNLSGNGADLNALGTEPAAFSAAPVTTADACQAAYDVKEKVGARGVGVGLDAVDREQLATMPATLPGCAAAAPLVQPVVVPQPDLVMTSFSAPSTVTIGVQFAMQVGLTNRGAGPATTSRLRIYLSPNNSLSADDTLLYDGAVAAMVPAASQSQTINKAIPSTVQGGLYYLLVVANADGSVKESNLTNNMTAVQINVSRPTPMPDLSLDEVSFPTVAQRGGSFGGNFNVVNQGTAPAPGSRVKIYLSTDKTLSTSDVLLRSRWVSEVASGTSQKHGLADHIPADVKPGTYYVLVMVDADRTVTESNEANNVAVSTLQVR